MASVVRRYLLAETLKTWAVVAGVLLFLTLGLGLARFIADAAAGDLPVDAVLALALYSGVENLEIVLPVSVLLSVLLVIGRLCRDNEMAALFAGGAGLRVVYTPILSFALLLAMVGGVTTLYLAPRAQQAMDALGAANISQLVSALAPGHFRTFLDGDAVFYAKSRDAAGDLRDVFIRVRRENGEGRPTETVVTAQRAREQTDPDTGEVTLVLDDGWRYEGLPGRADYRIVKFAEHGVQLAPPQPEAGDDVSTQSPAALIARDTPKAAAELQTRLSVPVSIVLLALLALPVGRVPPRAGRYGRVIVGVLMSVIYVNAIHLAAASLEDGRISPWLGVWPVHALVLALAVGLVLRELGAFARLRSRGTP